MEAEVGAVALATVADFSTDEPDTQRLVDESVPDELLMALPPAPSAPTAAAQKPSSSSSKVKRLAHAKAPPQPKRPVQRPKALGEPKAVGDTCLEGLYTIIDSIGRGSFGEIWLVKHTRIAGDESLAVTRADGNRAARLHAGSPGPEARSRMTPGELVSIAT